MSKLSTTIYSERKTSGVYAIINRRTGQIYIGSSIDMDRRRRDHSTAAKRGRGRLYREMRKHGEDTFDFEVIEDTAAENLLARERFWIAFFGATSGDDMNVLRLPGIRGQRTVWTDDMKERVGASQKRRMANMSSEQREQHKAQMARARAARKRIGGPPLKPRTYLKDQPHSPARQAILRARVAARIAEMRGEAA